MRDFTCSHTQYESQNHKISQNLSMQRDESSGESRGESKRSITSIAPKQLSSKKILSPSPSTTDDKNPISIKEIPTIGTVSPGSYTPSRSHPRETLLDIRRRTRASENRTVVDDITLINAVKADYRFIYRINDGVGTVNTILQQVCDERGWREFHETVPGQSRTSSYERAMRSATGWNLWWSYSAYQFSPYKYLRHWQFTNHNPKGFQFCNKLYLTQYLRKMRVVHGPIFDFYPLSYIVPEDYIRLSLDHTKRATESFTLISYSNLLNPSDVYKADALRPQSPPSASVIISKRLKPPLWSNRAPQLPSPTEVRFSPVWISKPVAQSQGKGIFLTADLTNITTDKKSVIQEYICRPLLIAGFKWDLRLYICVAAIDPLNIYAYNEGLCRFCTEKYNTTDLSQTYSHLTNTSLNKLSPTYEKDKELIGLGCKWTLRRLRQYFRDHGICDWYLWQRIMSLVVLTVIGDSLRLGYSASNRNCFDLFGFDVLVDEEMKPWLLECNYSPGLGGDSETDEIVKRPMLHQLFDLLGFPDCSCYSRASTATETNTANKLDNGQDNNIDDDLNSGTIYPSGSPSGDDVINYDKDKISQHYFELLMDKMKRTQADLNVQKVGAIDQKYKWNSPVMEYSPEARLMDAKTIYSQNLVVQYLKNQCQGKISHKVREQLITLATKKLKNKLTGTRTCATGSGEKKPAPDKRQKSESPPDSATVATQYDKEDLHKTDDISTLSVSSDSLPSSCFKEVIAPSANHSSRDVTDANAKKPRSRSAPSSAETASTTTITFSTNLFGTLKKEFPHPNSEAFQKLKHYFDAGVDYPLDLKTGKFKECPALLTEKKDWFNPVTREGGWIRLYPFDARTTKSPYKSSLTDIRQAVRSVETYLKTAEQIFLLHPGESDEFYRRKMKQTCRRDTDVWIPPLTNNACSAPSNNQFHNSTMNLNLPAVTQESVSQYYVAVEDNTSCTE